MKMIVWGEHMLGLDKKHWVWWIIDERWGARKGLAQEKLVVELEINAQERGRIRQRWKNLWCAIWHLRAWGYDTFLQNNRFSFYYFVLFFPGNFNSILLIWHRTWEERAAFILFFLDSLKLSDGEKIGWGKQVMVKPPLPMWQHHHDFWFPTSNFPREVPAASLLKIKDVMGGGGVKKTVTICSPDKPITFTNCMYVTSCIISWHYHPSLITNRAPTLILYEAAQRGPMGNFRLAFGAQSTLQHIRNFFLERAAQNHSVSFPKKKKAGVFCFFSFFWKCAVITVHYAPWNQSPTKQEGSSEKGGK